jgi:hypothetical protein
MSDNTPRRTRAAAYFRDLQDRICASLAQLEAFVDELCHGGEPCWAAHVLRRAISEATCERLAANFHRLIAEQGSQRAADGYVEVEQIGVTQFRKRAAEYLSLSQQAQSGVAALFAGILEPQRQPVLLTDWLRQALVRGAQLAQPGGFHAGAARGCGAGRRGRRRGL